ncbi:hypothetical protein MSIMFB_02408 [Mycobacterium simulans]|uniref:Nucleotidyl transferase domain-containing protein n=1 Tax=Mycobacterium simulans TaxID=627089 RepID=A0A7Z7N9K6_9MYCO|nr:hypothetical protein [Mycobacterium simulans]SOJ54917.1 hypothetical protein MSIMFB_02408 [Mycobacterium simulans]
MSQALVLFCGGPPIYSGVPKPLQTLPTGETLLERFLHHVEPRVPRDVVILCDSAFTAEYEAVAARLAYSAALRVHACTDGSTTLTKLSEFLDSGYPADRVVELSYPDVFVAGDIATPADDDPRLVDGVFISYTPIFSRFPRLVVDAYDGEVKGISNHTSPVPANPLHVFGGHLVAGVGVIKSLLEAFLAETMLPSPSLEFDMFYWLINTSRMHTMAIGGRWVQADSPREIAAVVSQF